MLFFLSLTFVKILHYEQMRILLWFAMVYINIFTYIYIFQYVARKRNISHLKAVTNNFIRQSGYAMSRFIDNEVNYT